MTPAQEIMQRQGQGPRQRDPQSICYTGSCHGKFPVLILSLNSDVVEGVYIGSSTQESLIQNDQENKVDAGKETEPHCSH